MLKKIVLLTGIGVTGMAMGIGIVHARWHPVPGVDIPYDSANYYSLTTISVPDSAPSTFALRDLAGAGGNVIDVTRLAKSVLFGEKYVTMQENKIFRNENTEKNMKPLSDSNLQKTLSIIKSMNSKTQSQAKNIDITGEGKFAQAPTPDMIDEISKLSEREQLAWLSKTYTDLAQSAKDSDAQISELLKASEKLLKISAEAEGEMQARQSGTSMEALKQSAIMQFTQTLNTLAKLRAVKELKANSDHNTFRAKEMQKNMRIVDPYDEKAYQAIRDTLGLERKERPKAFPSFSEGQ